MEITTHQASAVKIKGKSSSLLVNASKTQENDVSISLRGANPSSVLSQTEGLVIGAPGEYEIGGIKIRGTRADGIITYSVYVDGVEILLAKISDLQKIHGRLQEHMIVLADTDINIDPSFLSSLASNMIVLFGPSAKELANQYMKDTYKELPKIATTKDKLPQEVESILLQ